MPTERKLFIVEVEAYEGEDTSILVFGAEQDGAGRQPALYCIAKQDEEDGVLRFIDWGYRTIDEVLEAWPEAVCKA